VLAKKNRAGQSRRGFLFFGALPFASEDACDLPANRAGDEQGDATMRNNLVITRRAASGYSAVIDSARARIVRKG